MGAFNKFGKPQPEGEKLGFTFSFNGDELDKEPTSKYRPISKGEHPFTVSNLTFGVSKKGNNQVVVTLSTEDDKGEVLITDYLVLTDAEQSVVKIATFFSSIGMWEGPDGVKAMGVREDTWDKAIGKTGHFINRHEEFNGETRNKVSRYVKTLKPAVG